MTLKNLLLFEDFFLEQETDLFEEAANQQGDENFFKRIIQPKLKAAGFKWVPKKFHPANYELSGIFCYPDEKKGVFLNQQSAEEGPAYFIVGLGPTHPASGGWKGRMNKLFVFDDPMDKVANDAVKYAIELKKKYFP